MEFTQEQKPNVEIVQAVDVELNEEQLDVVAGGDRIKDFIDDVIDFFTPKKDTI
jgi:transcription antitermination factor NusA-like protein